MFRSKLEEKVADLLFELNIDYTVDISLSATGYFVGFIFIIIGYGLTRYE